jgi:hypothetical protein
MRVCVLIAAKNEGIAIGSTIDSIVAAGVDKKNVYLVSDGLNRSVLQGKYRWINRLDTVASTG